MLMQNSWIVMQIATGSTTWAPINCARGRIRHFKYKFHDLNAKLFVFYAKFTCARGFSLTSNPLVPHRNLSLQFAICKIHHCQHKIHHLQWKVHPFRYNIHHCWNKVRWLGCVLILASLPRGQKWYRPCRKEQRVRDSENIIVDSLRVDPLCEHTEAAPDRGPDLLLSSNQHCSIGNQHLSTETSSFLGLGPRTSARV